MNENTCCTSSLEHFGCKNWHLASNSCFPIVVFYLTVTYTFCFTVYFSSYYMSQHENFFIVKYNLIILQQLPNFLKANLKVVFFWFSLEVFIWCIQQVDKDSNIERIGNILYVLTFCFLISSNPQGFLFW